MHNGPPRRLAGPGGTPTGGSSPLKYAFFSRFILTLSFPFPHSAVPHFSVVSENMVLAGWRNIGARGKAIGHSGPLRNPAEPDGAPRNLAEPNGTPTGGHYTAKSACFSRLWRFRPLVFPLPHPFPNTQRFVGFETPGIVWRAGYRGEGKGQLAQWATAELGGGTWNHG